jgi:hypothetical protein
MSRRAPKGWIRHVRQTSDAMDIPEGLFTRSPRAIAAGLKHAVMASDRTKGTKFQSAMSMLNWFINRGGRGISRERRDRLEEAKIELRALFARSPEGQEPKRVRKKATASRRN